MIDEKTKSFQDAEVTITELGDGRRRITVKAAGFQLSEADRSIETRYPVELIDTIFRLKGPRYATDEIRRDEDPLYTQACLETDILAYVPREAFRQKRMLDFGCGAGASTLVLARLFPESEIAGIELDEKLLSVAHARAAFYGYDNLSFHCSPNSKTLPSEMGEFDYVILSAVFEHLLPDERQQVLGQIWSLLKPGGIFFLNQTPNRWFPFEGHTTQLPLMNYLPDKAAGTYARRFSKMVSSEATWTQLLRRGIRGGSVREILGILKGAQSRFRPVLLTPQQAGFQDRIDLWYAGYAVSIAKKYPRVKVLQLAIKYLAKVIYKVSGVVFLPTISLAIQKKEIAAEKVDGFKQP